MGKIVDNKLRQCGRREVYVTVIGERGIPGATFIQQDDSKAAVNLPPVQLKC